MEMKGCLRRGFSYLVLPVLVGPLSAWAAKWQVTESVTLSETYTDNVRLEENDPEGGWVTIVSPNVVLSGKGKRMSTEFVGAFQLLSHAEKKFYPRMRGQLDSELYDRRLFLSAWLSAEQEAIDPLKPAGSPSNRTGNLTTTYGIGINPYWKERIGDFAYFRADYEYSRHFYTASSLGDRYQHNVFLTISDGPRFGPANWSLNSSYKKTFYQKGGASDTTFKSLSLRLGYDLTRSLSPYVSIGKEWNSYDTSRSRRGGDEWLIGTVWSPNPRLRLDVGYGYRFFGHYPMVDLKYRRRHSSLTLGYTRNLESGYGPSESQSFLATTDQLGNPVNPFAGNPGAIAASDGFNSLSRSGAYVDDTFRASYLFQGKRTNLGATARYSKKEYQLQPQKILEWRLRLTALRHVSRNLSADIWTSWHRVEDETDFRADTWQLGLGVTRQLGNYTRLRLGYVYANRDSNRANDSYQENRIAVILSTSMVGLAKQAGWY